MNSIGALTLARGPVARPGATRPRRAAALAPSLGLRGTGVFSGSWRQTAFQQPFEHRRGPTQQLARPDRIGFVAHRAGALAGLRVQRHTHPRQHAQHRHRAHAAHPRFIFVQADVQPADGICLRCPIGPGASAASPWRLGAHGFPAGHHLRVSGGGLAVLGDAADDQAQLGGPGQSELRRRDVAHNTNARCVGPVSFRPGR